MHFQRLGFDKLLRNCTCVGQIRFKCALYTLVNVVYKVLSLLVKIPVEPLDLFYGILNNKHI